MAQLPTSLFCLTLAHSIDDVDTVERYLAEYGDEVERCIPIALRYALESPKLPDVPFFTASQLEKYLSMLWSPLDAVDKMVAAAEQGLIYLMPYLFERTGGVRAGDALDAAIRNDHIDIVKLFFTKYEPINMMAALERELVVAARHGRDDIITFLLRYKPIQEALNDALWEAVNNNHISTTKLLLDSGADIHDRNDVVLILSVNRGNIEMVRLLLQRGANVHARNNDALYCAQHNGNIDMINVIREYMGI